MTGWTLPQPLSEDVKGPGHSLFHRAGDTFSQTVSSRTSAERADPGPIARKDARLFIQTMGPGSALADARLAGMTM